VTVELREPAPESETQPQPEMREDAPDRGIVWGVVIVSICFWLPIALITYLLGRT
jgi:hypothetical protein